jgi:hypothetical protein
LLSTVAWLDWLWLSLLVITGLLLFFAHKTAWSLAVLVLLAVIGINIYRAANAPIGVPYSPVHMIVSTLVTCAVLGLAFYFRYPYLDRRARWFFPTAHRYDLQTNVQVVANDIFEGVTESISMSGARLRLKRDLGPQKSKLRYVDVIYTQIRNLKISCEVVEYSDNILRVRHKSLSVKDREILAGWLQSQNETKADSIA